jgi:hypothetical protein
MRKFEYQHKDSYFIHMLNRTSKEIKHVSQCGPTANLNFNKGFDLEEKGISADTTIQG